MKDLSRLGRDLRRVLILDNSPASYVFHPDNAVSVMQDPDRGLRSKKGVSPFGLCLHFCFQAGLWPRPGAFSFFLLSCHRPVPTPLILYCSFSSFCVCVESWGPCWALEQLQSFKQLPVVTS